MSNLDQLWSKAELSSIVNSWFSCQLNSEYLTQPFLNGFSFNMGHSATLNNRYTTDLAIVIDAIQNSAPHFFHRAGLALWHCMSISWHAWRSGNLSLDDRSKRTAQCWVCNWSRLASHSGLWASPPPRTMSTNANKPVGEASSNPVLRCSVALVVLT